MKLSEIKKYNYKKTRYNNYKASVTYHLQQFKMLLDNGNVEGVDEYIKRFVAVKYDDE